MIKHAKLISISLTMVFLLGIFLSPAPVGAAAGTTGKFDPVVSFYNPGTPYMLKEKNLQDGAYYAVLIGSNLASTNQVWDNFTASGTSHYSIFNINSFTTETKLSVTLYGAINDSDTAATSLASLDLELIDSGSLLSQDWFLGVAFIIIIFFIFVGVIASLVMRKGKKSSY